MDWASAEKCCSLKTCEDCGTELSPKHYYTVCDFCREKRKYDRAEKANLIDYINKDPYLPVFTKEGKMIRHDELCCLDSEDDWKDYFDDDGAKRPDYVYGAKRQFVKLNSDSWSKLKNGQKKTTRLYILVILTKLEHIK